MSAGFVHLHCHTEYSVLDGQCKVHELLEKCHEFGMKACAITDHGVLFGALDFYLKAKTAGIKPIIGSELYVAKGPRHVKTGGPGNYYHFLLLCENEEGYHNLCKLSSLGFLEGFHYKPRVDDELLARYSKGLIATSSCLQGEVPQHLLEGNLDAANAAVEKFIRIFGKDNFLIEVMDHGIEDQRRINPLLAELAEKHGLMMIATNDCHYVNKDDAGPHEALLCVQTNTTLHDEKRFRFPTNQVYFRGPDEMRALFPQWPHAITNTEIIAERCNLQIPLEQRLIPKFTPDDGSPPPDYLRRLVHAGLKERYGDPPPKEHLERAEYELGVIEKVGFSDYFLVTWDLIRYARENGIPVGPGRGSGAGSIVAYALKITNIDPMRYHLLFERFLNPDRVTMPDFDIDFCYARRDEMIDYAKRKYGDPNVSQIITFGRMLAKQVVRNVGRVLGMTYGDVDRIAKLIPDEPKITLDEASERVPALKELIQNDPQINRLWKIARRLEGTIGNCGTHAAGVVICDGPLIEHVALYKASGADTIATQVEMNGLEKIGLLKMDFLGLRTLTVIHDAARLVRENGGPTLDIDNLDMTDPKTYELLRSGQTTGIFQLESSGMRDLAKRIGLETLEEICALVALFRPGPMQFIDTYIHNKHHPQDIQYDHPLLEPILRETYGIPVYQEQVMQIVQAIAGFTLAQADIVRRAMSKKKADLLAEQKAKFIEGAKNTNNIGTKLADALWQKIETFAGYGFNKSHSMAYAFVAYQTAYLKANHPAEFMAALLSSESGNLEKTALYVEECRRMGIEVLPPDVNSSDLRFTVHRGAIRFGLLAVKNVGEGPAAAIVEQRNANGPFRDIFDFCARLAGRALNKKLIESLNKAGAFTTTGWTRAQVAASLDAAVSEAQLSQRERDSGQTTLLQLMAGGEEAPAFHEKPNLPEWPEHEVLAAEKEILGLYVTSHPLAKHIAVLERFSTVRVPEIPDLPDGREVVLGGIITAVRTITTSKGKPMAFMTIETLHGPVEITIFTDLYTSLTPLIATDNALMVRAKVNYRNGEAGLIANDLIPIEDAEARLTRAVHVRINGPAFNPELIDRLSHVLGDPANAGPCDVYLHCLTPDHGEVTIHAASACKVAPSTTLLKQVEDLLGPGSLWYSAGNGLPRH